MKNMKKVNNYNELAQEAIFWAEQDYEEEYGCESLLGVLGIVCKIRWYDDEKKVLLIKDHEEERLTHWSSTFIGDVYGFPCELVEVSLIESK